MLPNSFHKLVVKASSYKVRNFTMLKGLNFDLFIAGAGTGGLSACVRLHRQLPKLKIGIADGSKVHCYQPSWALASVNLLDFDKNRRPMKSLIPKGVTLLESNVKTFLPKENCVILEEGTKVTYDCLLITCGLEINYSTVPGVKDALDNDPSVFTIFDSAYNRKAFDAMNAYTGDGLAIFTYPMNENFKCKGAPAKILFLANDMFEKKNIKNRQVVFVSPKTYLFSIPRYNKPLEEIALKRKIETRYNTEVVGVDHNCKSITVRHDDGSQEEIKYSLLHFTPEMRTPLAVRSCAELVDKSGFVDVNPYTLVHTTYPNVFSCGDCSNIPTSKTAAAISEQLHTLVPNIKSRLKDKQSILKPTYTGYTACPLLCGHQKVVLAEFDYEKNPMETFPFDQSKPRRSMYLLKKYFMPKLYWDLFVRGRWTGPHTLRNWLHRIFFFWH